MSVSNFTDILLNTKNINHMVETEKVQEITNQSGQIHSLGSGTSVENFIEVSVVAAEIFQPGLKWTSPENLASSMARIYDFLLSFNIVLKDRKINEMKKIKPLSMMFS